MRPKFKNFKKRTPDWAVKLSNAVLYGALAIQPFIAGAPETIMGEVTKWWVSMGISAIAGLVKGYTMFLAVEEPYYPSNGVGYREPGMME